MKENKAQMRGIKYLWHNLEYILAAVFFVIMLVALFIQVFFRFVLNNPIGWTEELAVTCFVMMVYIGSIGATRNDEHMKMEMVINLFYPQIGVKPCSMAGGGVSETIWNCLKTAPAGTGQPLTCSTSGMGLRLKWISMEMCRVLSLSMCSWTTISLIRRFRVAASSSVMSAYS